MKRRLTSILLLVSFSLTLANSAQAANYSFRLLQETVNIYWEQDGTATIDYVFVFANDANAAPIDIVSVDLPTGGGNSAVSLSWDVNGEPRGSADTPAIPVFQDSIVLLLQQAAIAPGATGTVHIHVGGVEPVLYPDIRNFSYYISAVFSSTSFESTQVRGETDLTVIFHLPPGVQPAEARYHAAPAPFPAQPEAALDDAGRVTYTWHTANASGSTQYRLGASFPASGGAAGGTLIWFVVPVIIGTGIVVVWRLRRK